MFVKYDDNDVIEEKLVNAEHISWDCLDIRCHLSLNGQNSN